MAMVKQKVFLIVISPSVSYHSVAERDEIALILLQIVMVSPGTHPVKNHESLSTRLLPNGRPVARGAQGKSMGDQISVQGARAGA